MICQRISYPFIVLDNLLDYLRIVGFTPDCCYRAPWLQVFNDPGHFSISGRQRSNEATKGNNAVLQVPNLDSSAEFESDGVFGHFCPLQASFPCLQLCLYCILSLCRYFNTYAIVDVKG